MGLIGGNGVTAHVAETGRITANGTVYIFGATSSSNPKDSFHSQSEALKGNLASGDVFLALPDGSKAADVLPSINDYLHKNDKGSFVNIVVADHGEHESFGEGYDIKYTDLIEAMPPLPDKHSNYYVLIRGCFGSAAQDDADKLIPGSVVFANVSRDSFNYTPLSALSAMQYQNKYDLPVDHLYTLELLTTDYVKFASDNAYWVKDARYQRFSPTFDVEKIVPTKIAISHGGTIDLKDEIKSLKGVDLTPLVTQLEKLAADSGNPLPQGRLAQVALGIKIGAPVPAQDLGLASALAFQHLQVSGQFQRRIDQAKNAMPERPWGIDEPQQASVTVLPAEKQHAPDMAPDQKMSNQAVLAAAGYKDTADAKNYADTILFNTFAGEQEAASVVKYNPQRDSMNGFQTANIDIAKLRQVIKAGSVLKYGSRGEAVGELQRFLRAQGFTGQDGKELADDGRFGKNTEFALTQFQRNHGLTYDGKVGSNTLKEMTDIQIDQMMAQQNTRGEIYQLRRVSVRIGNTLTAAEPQNIAPSGAANSLPGLELK